MQAGVDMAQCQQISPLPILLHSRNASCMEYMRIILRLQAGTGRRTPIECVPLKKRQETGNRTASLHTGQIY